MDTNVLLQNGQIFDGSGSPAQAVDLRIRDGRIAEIGPSLPPHGESLLNASGLLVTPGLIDLHVHVYSGMGRWSVDPDDAGLKTGVTTMLDTGTAGALTYPAFHWHVIPRAREDVYALLNIAMIGCLQGYPDTPPHNIGELCLPGYAHAPSAVECVRQYPDRLIGIKVRLTASLADHRPDYERIGLDEALKAARELDLPLMVHHANSSVPLPDLLAALRPGDIITHLYHPHPDHGFAEDGEPLACMREARERGILFDVGHGVGAFAWDVAEPACRNNGFRPDTISTDLHRYNLHGPVWDLPTTMSKLLHLGMPLPEVIRATTNAPSRAMGLEGRFGRLLPGREADVTLLRLEDGEWDLPDVRGEMRTIRQRFVPVQVLKRGVLNECEGRRDEPNIARR
ncbi:MAG: amidohydrolase/deacetylase family metallohydrolase [Armatimonadetes bacterium]|nr:amidohydrolase/deacetylase family metallohydrolase [Armatimonadota bacterium]